MMNINDDVFGKMEYKNSWEKEEIIKCFGKEYKIRTVAKAYKGDDILDIQRNAYKKYKDNINNYNIEIPSSILNYYLDNYEYISSYIDIPEKINKDNINEEIIMKLVTFKTLYFDRKGNFGYLCDCLWDEEHGICILLSDKKVKVIEQDELI